MPGALGVTSQVGSGRDFHFTFSPPWPAERAGSRTRALGGPGPRGDNLLPRSPRNARTRGSRSPRRRVRPPPHALRAAPSSSRYDLPYSSADAGRDGFEFATAIRADPSCLTPLLMLTSSGPVRRAVPGAASRPILLSRLARDRDRALGRIRRRRAAHGPGSSRAIRRRSRPLRILCLRTIR